MVPISGFSLMEQNSENENSVGGENDDVIVKQTHHAGELSIERLFQPC